MFTMEIGSHTICNTNITDHFKFIPFVVSSAQISEDVIQKPVFQSELSGKEASQFYEAVIATPSTSVTCENKEFKKKHKIKKNKISSVIPENTRLTIFHYAQSGNIEGINHCLSKQTHVDVQDIYGWTPLMCATFEGHFSVVKHLLKCGAKLDLKSKQGLSAIDIALKQNNKELIELFNNGFDDCDICPVSREVEKVKFCNMCNVTFKESIATHEKSIAHLLSCQKDGSSTYYSIPENNKGFQIMLKKGWDKNKGLGIDAQGRKFPIKTVMKTDRTCIGAKKEVAKVTHFGPNDYHSVAKNVTTSLNMKREKKIKKCELKRLEKRNRQLEIEFRRQFHCN